jgi:hypothetical protein
MREQWCLKGSGVGSDMGNKQVFRLRSSQSAASYFAQDDNFVEVWKAVNAGISPLRLRKVCEDFGRDDKVVSRK